MSTKDPRAILISKTDIPEAEIRALSDAAAWRLIYSIPKPKRQRLTEICFTGFRKTERDQYEAMATKGGLAVKKSVTQNLAILVCGPTAGPVKLERAAERGTYTMDIKEFSEFLETGEIPLSS